MAKGKKYEVKAGKISDLQFDDKNLNKHTQAGMGLLEKSITTLGLGRSVLVDKNGKLIAGNGVTEISGQVGLEDTVIVKTHGDVLVVVQREDIDINTKKGRELAFADNKVSEVNLSFDHEEINNTFEEFNIQAEEWLHYPEDKTNKEKKKVEFDANLETKNECPKCGYEW